MPLPLALSLSLLTASQLLCVSLGSVVREQPFQPCVHFSVLLDEHLQAVDRQRVQQQVQSLIVSCF